MLESAEAFAKFVEKLGRDLVAAVAVHRPENALLVVVLKQRLAGLLELLQTCFPHFWVVISPSREWLARDVILSVHFWRIKCGVVNASGRLMHPAIAYAIDDDVTGRVKVDDQVDGYDVVQLKRLSCGSGEAVEYERC